MDKNASDNGAILSVITYDNCYIRHEDGSKTPIKFLRNPEWGSIENTRFKDFRIMLMFPGCPRRLDMNMCINTQIHRAAEKGIQPYALRQYKKAIELRPFGMTITLALDDAGTTIFDDWIISKDYGIRDIDKYVIEIEPPEN